MAKFCVWCGKALIEDAKTCIACGKAVPISPNTINQQTVNDAKKQFANATAIIKEKSLKVAEQFNEDLKGINKARSKAFEDGKEGDGGSGIDKAKTLSKSFWGNLTGKQKGIVIGGLVLVIFIVAKLFSHSDSENFDGYSSASNSNVKSDPFDALQSAYYSFSPNCRQIFGESTSSLIVRVKDIRKSGANNSAGMGSVEGQLMLLRNNGCAPRK